MDYNKVDYAQVHKERARTILKVHPEARKLMGPNIWSFPIVVGMVMFQLCFGVLIESQAWWVILLCSYFVGAYFSHGLYVMDHELCHNLVFKKATKNKLLGIFGDLGIGFPSYVSFAKYHLIHHAHLGEYDYDPDIVTYAEGNLVKNSTWRKLLWMTFFFFSQGFLRTGKIKGTKVMNKWVAFNMIFVATALTAYAYTFGVWAYLYIFFSTLFALGLHPLGGRWIQEHYTFEEGQETFSYYGPLNKFGGFNIGYHNEHHDLMNVPWNRLPKLKALAPEMYDHLHHHTSLTKVLWDFITNPKMSPYSRIVHPSIDRRIDRNVVHNDSTDDQLANFMHTKKPATSAGLETNL